MAGKNKEMSQIKQLLQMHHQGCSIKNIARTLGMSKNTVKGYLRKLAANGDTCPPLARISWRAKRQADDQSVLL